MRFFFAYNGAKPHLVALKDTGIGPYNILLSYEYLKMPHLEMIKSMLSKWFILDSGAFSAWTKKKTIPVGDYIEAIGKVQEVMGDCLIAVNLDVIPGEYGRRPTALEVQEACELGWENYQRIRKETTAEVMPVFHQHDDWAWLDRYIKSDCYLLGISPANDLTTDKRRPFLSRCFGTVRDQKRCHGLAATALPLLLDYPWYSVDSATWTIGPGMGRVAVFDPSRRSLRMPKYRQKEEISMSFRAEYMDRGEYKGYKSRIKSFVRANCAVEAYVTEVWERKGFLWSD